MLYSRARGVMNRLGGGTRDAPAPERMAGRPCIQVGQAVGVQAGLVPCAAGPISLKTQNGGVLTFGPYRLPVLGTVSSGKPAILISMVSGARSPW